MFEQVPSPDPWLKLLEMRAPWEHLASFLVSPAWSLAPAGDGHDVMVLPGLASGDTGTLLLRQFLAARGFAVHGWGQGVNMGLRDGVIEHAQRKLLDYFAASGRKVSLVGWSLGGLYARELAKLSPEAVRCVVTLGSPFADHPTETTAWKFYEAASGHSIGSRDLQTPLNEAPPAPTTSIFSRSDGIVAWRCSVGDKRALVENIVVDSSHMGLGAHPAALYAIADRLSQPEGEWAPFGRGGWKSWIYGAADA